MRLRLGFLVACAVSVVWACSADPPLADETDTVITVRDADVSFAGFKTFVLNPTLDELCVQSESRTSDPDSREDDDAECYPVDHSDDSEVLKHLAEDLDELGWNQLSVSQLDEADLYLSAGIVARDYWNLGKGYCLDNTIVDGCISALTEKKILAPSGSLILALVDLQASESSNLKALWAASIDQRWAALGVLGLNGDDGAAGAGGTGGSGTDTFDLDQWLAGIDQAFLQSPYLGGTESK